MPWIAGNEWNCTVVLRYAASRSFDEPREMQEALPSISESRCQAKCFPYTDADEEIMAVDGRFLI